MDRQAMKRPFCFLSARRLPVGIGAVLLLLLEGCAINATARQGSVPGPQHSLVFGRLVPYCPKHLIPLLNKRNVFVRRYSTSGVFEGSDHRVEADATSGFFAMELPPGRYGIYAYMMSAYKGSNVTLKPGVLVFDAVANEARYIGGIWHMCEVPDGSSGTIRLFDDFAAASAEFQTRFPNAGVPVNRIMQMGSPTGPLQM